MRKSILVTGAFVATMIASLVPQTGAAEPALSSDRWVVTVAADRAAAVGKASGSPALAATNWIGNVTPNATKLGVIHVRDGNYTHGNYDVALPSGEYTDLLYSWTTTAGWYTGPGWCTRQWRSPDGVTFTQQLPNLGPGQHFIGANTYYLVEAYKSSTC